MARTRLTNAACASMWRNWSAGASLPVLLSPALVRCSADAAVRCAASCAASVGAFFDGVRHRLGTVSASVPRLWMRSAR